MNVTPLRMSAAQPGNIVEVEFCVEPNYAGYRLDKYLSEKIRRLSRTRIQKIIERDLISEKPMKASTLLTPGLVFRLRKKVLDEPGVTHLESLREIFQDDDLLVLDKPAGLPVHPTARYFKGTVTSQIKEIYGDSFYAYPAHRLDRETSGILICGKSAETNATLMRAFVTGSVIKQYLAICEGQPKEDEFEVSAAISEGTAAVRIAVRIDPNGKNAVTQFVVERRFERDGAQFSVIRCFPKTGRQHQIRVHLQHAGFSLVGDKMYGPSPLLFDRFSKNLMTDEDKKILRLERHALHAAQLEMRHPRTNERAVFESPLPNDLKEFLST